MCMVVNSSVLLKEKLLPILSKVPLCRKKLLCKLELMNFIFNHVSVHLDFVQANDQVPRVHRVHGLESLSSVFFCD